MITGNISTTKEILRFEGVDRLAFWRHFSLLLGLSVVIATMGLVRDSGAVIIAAMLVAPLMTPILGVAAAIVMGWPVRALVLMVIVCVAATASVGVAWAIVWIADFPRGVLLPHEVLSRTDPGAEDLVIALAAGVAGAYVQIHKSFSSLVPGAAIGVSLVPPLAAAGVLLYFGQSGRAYEAALLFATNFGAIVLSACCVYLLTGAGRALIRKGTRRTRFSLGLGVASIFLVIVFVQLISATYVRFTETRAEEALAAKIRQWSHGVSVEIIRVDVEQATKTAEIWAIIDLPANAQYRIASTIDLLPSNLMETPFRDVVREILGEDFNVVLRYQTRIAWEINLKTYKMGPAPFANPHHDE